MEFPQQMSDITILFLLSLVLALSYIASRLYQFYAIKKDLLANVNLRSAHDSPKPTGSGIVLLILFFFCILLLGYWQLVSTHAMLACIGPLFVGIIGYIDDRKELAVKVRMPLYIGAAIWSVYILGFPMFNLGGIEVELGFVGLVFGVMSLFWLQNLFNFMDGIDGIAGTEVVFVCFAAVWIGSEGLNNLSIGNLSISSPGSDGWSIIVMITGLLALGYLITNWPPSRMFMGDAGSNFFGLMLGVFILGDSSISIWVWLILLNQFIVDACLTVSIRLFKRQKIVESHSQHAYQHLNRRFGTVRVLQITILINLIWLLPIAYIAHRFPEQGFILLLLASLPLVLKDWLSGTGKDKPRMASLRVS